MSELKGARERAFDYRLDLLKWELASLDTIIGRMDQMAQATKNWSILVWAGALSLVVGNELPPNVKPLVLLATGAIPLLFWRIDALFRRLQRRSIYRTRKISEFINSSAFVQAFDIHDFGSFSVIDQVGASYKGDSEYQVYTSLSKVARFKEVRQFYLGLAAVSTLLALFFWGLEVFPIP